jgi:hypothetical protein
MIPIHLFTAQRMKVLPEAPSGILIEQSIESVYDRLIALKLLFCRIWPIPSAPRKTDCCARLRDRETTFVDQYAGRPATL